MNDFYSDASSFSFSPIAFIESCYPERFGIPRQAGLVPTAHADIVFKLNETNKLALRGIEGFSHIWVLFVFHQHHYKKLKPLVQPPRLGGRKTMGVYATRSPNRPNPVGMSVVKVEALSQEKKSLRLKVLGGDFLEGTPVLDIKPYVAYADAIPHAESSWVTPMQSSLTVQWTEQAVASLPKHLTTNDLESLKQLISETLAQDPRPAYEQAKDGRDGQEWNMQFKQFSVFWYVKNNVAFVARLVSPKNSSSTESS